MRASASTTASESLPISDDLTDVIRMRRARMAGTPADRRSRRRRLRSASMSSVWMFVRACGGGAGGGDGEIDGDDDDVDVNVDDDEIVDVDTGSFIVGSVVVLVKAETTDTGLTVVDVSFAFCAVRTCC